MGARWAWCEEEWEQRRATFRGCSQHVLAKVPMPNAKARPARACPVSGLLSYVLTIVRTSCQITAARNHNRQPDACTARCWPLWMTPVLAPRFLPNLPPPPAHRRHKQLRPQPQPQPQSQVRPGSSNQHHKLCPRARGLAPSLFLRARRAIQF